MQTAKPSNRNDFSSIHARIGDLIGMNAVTTHLCNKTLTRRSNQARELHRPVTQPSPRSWNEALAFAADG